MSSVEERVRKIVVEQLGVDEEQVTIEASFVDNGIITATDDENFGGSIKTVYFK